MNRRSFLKASAIAPVALVLPAATVIPVAPPSAFGVRDLIAEARMVGVLLNQGVMSIRDARAYFGIPEDTEL